MHKISFVVRPTVEAPGVQATRGGSCGVQHPGPVVGAAIFGQRAAGGVCRHIPTLWFGYCVAYKPGSL